MFVAAFERCESIKMKTALICLCLSLLSGCSLFSHIPDNVIRGQRTIYENVNVSEENANQIIDRYVKDTKAAVTYHLHYVCEKEILDVDQGDSYEGYSDEWKEGRKDRLRKQRDDKIKSSFDDIDKIAEEMRAQITLNSQIARKLVGAVYNYLSTTPIEVDDIDFWIEKLKNGQRQD